MLVILDVRKNEDDSFRDKIKSVFHPYKINADIITKNEIAVLHILYIQKRGHIRFNKIYEYTIGAPKTILCSDKISLKDTPFIRFESDEFNIQMMKNFIINALKSADIPPTQLKISFYDPNAEYPLFAERLLDYTSELTVVSNMPKFYENESDRHMNERGIPMIVSNSLSKLTPCDILIAPSKIKTKLPSVPSSLVFTSHKPLVNISGMVITKYIPEFPTEYYEIKPGHTDSFYFMSALYTLCGITELDKLMPIMCEGNNIILYKEQIVKKIKSIVRLHNL